jgi:hypothetical protein
MFNHLGATFIEKVLGFQTIASLSSSFLTYEASALLATTISYVNVDLSLDRLAAVGTLWRLHQSMRREYSIRTLHCKALGDHG